MQRKELRPHQDVPVAVVQPADGEEAAPLFGSAQSIAYTLRIGEAPEPPLFFSVRCGPDTRL